MKIGYARVSTDEQTTNLQLDALTRHGVDEIVEDHGVSGTNRERVGMLSLMSRLQPGDTLVIYSLSRWGRDLVHLITSIAELTAKGVHIISIKENIDTSTASGKLTFHLFCVLAQFERDLTSERTTAALQALKARGVRLGRPPVYTPEQTEQVVQLARQGKSTRQIAALTGISKTRVGVLARNGLAREVS